jgi:hypothetical protein
MPGRTQESEEKEDYDVMVRVSCTVRVIPVVMPVAVTGIVYVPAAADGGTLTGGTLTGALLPPQPLRIPVRQANAKKKRPQRHTPGRTRERSPAKESNPTGHSRTARVAAERRVGSKCIA